MRAKQVAEEERKRFEEMAEEIIKILKKNNVTVEELPRIIQIVTEKVNNKIDKASIGKVLSL